MESRVCKYYMQGRCRFGDNCKFVHPGGEHNKGFQQKSANNYNRNYDYNRNNNYNQRNAGGNSNFSKHNVLHTIRKDIDDQRSSNMWPFSCYAFEGNYACLAEFPEYSMEEIRWEAYVANANNNFDQYQNAIAYLMNQVQEKRQYLYNIPKNEQDAVVKQAASSKWSETQNSAGSGGNSQRSLGGFPAAGIKNLLQNPFERRSENPFNQATPNSGGFGQHQQGSTFSSFNKSQNDPFNSVNTQPQIQINKEQSLTNNPQRTIGSFPQQDLSFFNQAPQPNVNVAQQTFSLNQPQQSPQPTNQTSVRQTQQNSDLTEENMKQFLADSFTLNSVPEIAPPSKYC